MYFLEQLGEEVQGTLPNVIDNDDELSQLVGTHMEIFHLNHKAVKSDEND